MQCVNARTGGQAEEGPHGTQPPNRRAQGSSRQAANGCNGALKDSVLATMMTEVLTDHHRGGGGGVLVGLEVEVMLARAPRRNIPPPHYLTWVRDCCRQKEK